MIMGWTSGSCTFRKIHLVALEVEKKGQFIRKNLIVYVEGKRSNRAEVTHFFHSLYHCNLHVRCAHNKAQSVGGLRIPKTTSRFSDGCIEG